MNRFGLSVLLFFFVSGLFVSVCNPVLTSSSVEDYWVTKAPMSQARINLGVISWDGKIYAIGGYIRDDSFTITMMNTNERYDPKTDTWVTLTAMPTPRSGFAIAAYQGKIYCMGGGTLDGWCSVNEVYDIATDSWSTKTSSLLTGKIFQTYVVNDQIFVSGNHDPYVYSPYLFRYDPASDVWTVENSMPSGAIVTSYTVDNKIICFVERKQLEPTPSYEQKVLVYDPESKSWGNEQTVPAIFGISASGITTGKYAPQKVYNFNVVGAQGVVVCDPLRTMWSNAKEMPTQRKNFGIAVVDDLLYAIGGDTNKNEQYIPIGYHGTLPHTTPKNFTNTALIAIGLTIGIVTTSLFIYTKKRKK